MKMLAEITQRLSQNKPLLHKWYGVKELEIFGSCSYVRQEQTEASDFDLLVEFSEVPSFVKNA